MMIGDNALLDRLEQEGDLGLFTDDAYPSRLE